MSGWGNVRPVPPEVADALIIFFLQFDPASDVRWCPVGVTPKQPPAPKPSAPKPSKPAEPPPPPKPALPRTIINLHGVHVIASEQSGVIRFRDQEIVVTTNQAQLARLLLRAAPKPVALRFLAEEVGYGGGANGITILSGLLYALGSVLAPAIIVTPVKGVGARLTIPGVCE